MSQKLQKVFSRRQSRDDAVLEQQIKHEIYTKLPLDVFGRYTNVRSLIESGSVKRKLTNFHINQKIKEYQNELRADDQNGKLKDLEFIGADEKYVAPKRLL